MAWDGIIFRAPANAALNDLPNDFQMPPLGSPEEIGDSLKKLFPDAKHYRGRCCIEGDDFWIELNFEPRNQELLRQSIGVRSNAGMGAIPVLREVCMAFDARLLDIQTGEFADLGISTISSMSHFAAWRDRNLGTIGHSADE